QIDRNVVNRPAGDTHNLCFLVRWDLVVQPTQGALLPIEGNIALYETRVQAVSLELHRTPTPGKETTLVFDRFQVYNKHALELGFGESQGSILNLSASDHFKSRDGDDEFSPPVTVLALLFKYLIAEIPRQQQTVVRHLFQQLLRSEDRQSRSRSVA